MFDIKTTINSIGLLFTLVGAYVVYANSPLNTHTIGGGDASTDFHAVEQAANRRNRLMRYGVYAIFAGTLLQIVSNYVSPTASN